MNGVMYFVEKLMAFPHRMAGTKEEKEAAYTIAEEYRKMGIRPDIQAFKILRNDHAYQLFYFSLFIISGVFLLAGYNIAALAIYAFGIFFYYRLEHSPRFFSKLLLPARSVNVSAEVKPAGRIKKTLVVLGHFDTAKATLALRFVVGYVAKRSRLMYDMHKKMPIFFRSPLFITNIGILMLLIAVIISFFSISLASVLVIVALAILALTIFFIAHWMLSPGIPGAFDNASGSAAVIALAKHFKNNPLKHTNLILLNNSSEEIGSQGIKAFLKENKLDKKSTVFINLDGIAGDQLYALYGESNGIGQSYYCNIDDYRTAKKIITEGKYKNIKPSYLATATDTNHIIQAGYRVMLTLISLNNDGYVQQYHQMSDTIDKLNTASLELAYDFIKTLIREFDREPG